MSTESLKSYKLFSESRYPDIVTYQDNNKVYLAYRVLGVDKWTSVLTPFTNETTDFQFVNLDSKNKSEIVVKGQIDTYGGHGGRTDYMLIVINVDSAPKQIFKIIYGGSIETFGNANRKTLVETYKRNIKINNQGIYLSPLSKKLVTGNETNIRGGRYIMKKDAIIRVGY